MKTINYFIIILTLFVLVFQSSCSSDEPTPDAPRTFADIEADFAAIDLSPGIQDVQLEMFNGVIYHFRVIAPDRADGELRPLILALHGAASQLGAEKNTACYVEPGLDTLRAFIISPYGEGGLWFSDFNQEMIANLMFLTQKYWPIETE